jgi:hypothetical protein
MARAAAALIMAATAAAAAGRVGGDCLRRKGWDGYFIEAGQQLEVCSMGGGRQKSSSKGGARRSEAGDR